jgi:hypothetical protein
MENRDVNRETPDVVVVIATSLHETQCNEQATVTVANKYGQNRKNKVTDNTHFSVPSPSRRVLL